MAAMILSVDARWKQLTPAVAALAAALCAASAAGADFAIEIGAGRLGHDGYLQTPTGGAPGTSSLSRPGFRELSADNGTYRWLGGMVAFGSNALSVRYTAIADQGTATLRDALVSQGRPFAAGDPLESRIGLDGLSLSYTRSFPIGDRTTLGFGPWLGWTAFDLKIDGRAHQVDRSYRVYALGATGRLDRKLGQRFRLRAEAIIAPAYTGSAGRFAVEPSLAYRLSAALELCAAIRLDAFRYDDAHKQVLPNRLRVDREVVPAISIRWLR